MIVYQDLDILALKSNAIIVHGVNTLGKMGRGIALDIRNKYPFIYDDYRKRCAYYAENNLTRDILGSTCFYTLDEDSDLLLVNLYSQLTIGRTGRHASELAIHDGLYVVADYINGMQAYEIQIYMPKIGCTNGGLNWEDDVLPMVQLVDEEFDSKVIFNVCQPPKN